MATTTTLGKVSLTMGGNYSPTATYDRLTVVRGVTGNSYVTTVDGVSGISPGVTSGWENYWQLFAADGEGGGGGGDLPSGGSPGDVLEKTANGTKWSSDVTELKSAITGKISAPSSPTTGQFLVYDGSAWVAQTVPAANGVNF